MINLRAWTDIVIWRLFSGAMLLFGGVMTAITAVMVVVLPILLLEQFGVEAPEWVIWVTIILGGVMGVGHGHEILKRHVDSEARQKADLADLKAHIDRGGSLPHS